MSNNKDKVLDVMNKMTNVKKEKPIHVGDNSILINGNVVGDVNINIKNSSIDRANLDPHKQRLINFIQAELKSFNNTIEKLTLWVLNVELSSLDSLTYTELQRLHYFLLNDK